MKKGCLLSFSMSSAVTSLFFFKPIIRGEHVVGEGWAGVECCSPPALDNLGHQGKACTSILRLGLVLIGNHRPVPAEIPMSNDVPRYASRLIRLDAVAAVPSHCKGNPSDTACFVRCKTFSNRRLACGCLPMIGARRSVRACVGIIVT